MSVFTPYARRLCHLVARSLLTHHPSGHTSSMGLYDTTYGAAHLGVSIGCMWVSSPRARPRAYSSAASHPGRLYGVTNLQTFLYFRTFPDDRPYHKLGVFWLW